MPGSGARLARPRLVDDGVRRRDRNLRCLDAARRPRQRHRFRHQRPVIADGGNLQHRGPGAGWLAVPLVRVASGGPPDAALRITPQHISQPQAAFARLVRREARLAAVAQTDRTGFESDKDRLGSVQDAATPTLGTGQRGSEGDNSLAFAATGGTRNSHIRCSGERTVATRAAIARCSNRGANAPAPP